MKLTLTMDLENAAFDTGYDDIKDGREVARILRDAADGFDKSGLKDGRASSLWDVNGNRVGTVTLEA